MEVGQLFRNSAVSGQESQTSALARQDLGKEDFLKLLVSQLQNQDPLNPSDNEDMILQLAQFSTLEGTQNLNDNFAEFLGTSYLGTASSMIGKQVSYYDADNGFVEVSGQVSKVNMGGDELSLVIDGKEILMSQVISIEQLPSPTE